MSKEISAPGKQCVEVTVCLTRHVRVKINMRALLPPGPVLYTSRPALYPITVKQLVKLHSNVKGGFFWTAL